jgi:hypothetical protein
MAQLGGGDFRDFRNNEPINFLNFRFGQVRRAFLIKDWAATNFSAPAGSPEDFADSDGDGFSDGVEVYFGRLGAPFNPIQIALPDGGGLDPGCPVALRGVDSDCDGLLDCDEQLIGTNAALVDSDRDGIFDGLEWQLKTQGASDDLDRDPDVDGIINRNELRLHSDPLTVDPSALTLDGYRYRLEQDGAPDSEGRQCYRLRVDNILLAPTLAEPADAGPDAGVGFDAGFVRGAGFNDVMLTFTLVPADEPGARTLTRSYRSRIPRYPVGGIKSPVDGVLHVTPESFIDGCGPAADGGS